MERHARVFVATLTAAATMLSLLVPTSAQALEINDVFKIGLHNRTRFIYLEGRDGDLSNPPLAYVENRARVTMSATPFEWGSAFFQLQDVRVWGEEANTLGDYSANGLDVHQAYITLNALPGSDVAKLRFRVGRQEINVEGQRLIGAVAWTPQARSFDAVRIMFEYDKSLFIDTFVALTIDSDSIIPGPPTNPNKTDAQVVAFNARYRLLSEGSDHADVSVTAIVDLHEALERTRYTLGMRHAAQFGPFRYRLEGFFQGGDIAGQDLSAFLLAARVGIKFSDPGILIEFWADHVSGGSNPLTASRRSFDTLFGTNHKFYGRSDFFLNLPVQTQGKGLVDLALKSRFNPTKMLTLGLDVHHMLVANPQGGPSAWGWGVDFYTQVKPVKGLSFFVGVFTMLPQTALINRLGGNDDPDVGVFTSVQADF